MHHLDLLSDGPAPADALRLARLTIEALIAQPLPGVWGDEEAVLMGTGRLSLPDGIGPVGDLLPAFS
ncbi:hypothetical protein [Flexivirga caeni]|uniref:Uncharacterized protein n=1 Tax=Flexivirga caeni TaxID=2294115 RepID=A0A3M9LTR4_9MICO|nr:hypothetical protein [Flexivirga caeni]RNI16632.1 hypothetical protein EFY87_19870 [Flexivirga caeni]